MIDRKRNFSSESGSFVKTSLLSILEVVEAPLKVWKQEKEEDRLLDLIAEAEATRSAAATTRRRRSLPAAADDPRDATVADAEEERRLSSWRQFVPMARTRAEAKVAKISEREARKAASRAALTAAGSAAVDAAFSAVADVAKVAVGPERLPSQGMSADERAGRQVGRSAMATAAHAARSVAAWASRRRDDARTQAEADAQRLRLAGQEDDLALLGIEVVEEGQGRRLITERQLRKARRERSRELHPDARKGKRGGAAVPSGEDEAAIYKLNEAFENLSKRL